MDVNNKFHTNQTFLWVRLEHGLVMVGCAALLLQHLSEVAWGRAIAAFLIIDLVGYIPGAIAYRRLGGKAIPAAYHHLYNVMHSYVVAAAWVGAWALALGRLEWAMLMVPLHLSGDRGLFGNTYKPTSLPFEPHPVAAPAPVRAPASGASP